MRSDQQIGQAEMARRSRSDEQPHARTDGRHQKATKSVIDDLYIMINCMNEA